MKLVHPRITDDRFVLVVEEADAAFDTAEIKGIFADHHVVEVEERLTSSEGGL